MSHDMAHRGGRQTRLLEAARIPAINSQVIEKFPMANADCAR